LRSTGVDDELVAAELKARDCAKPRIRRADRMAASMRRVGTRACVQQERSEVIVSALRC
jgi:hypothetical protein